MFKFLFISVFFIVLMTLLLGFSFLRTLKRIIFGGGNSAKRTTQQRQSKSSSGKQSTKQSDSSKKKIIPKEEGEYIDYEEIND